MRCTRWLRLVFPVGVALAAVTLRAQENAVVPGLDAAISAAKPRHLIPKRSRSASGQFQIYANDFNLRGMVASLADELRDETLRSLGPQPAGSWGKLPILIGFENFAPDKADELPAVVALKYAPDGPRIEINVRLGGDPAKVHLRRHIITAVLLERMYGCGSEPPAPDAEWVLPPWWLTTALVAHHRRYRGGLQGTEFSAMLEADERPGILSILQRPPDPGGHIPPLVENSAYALFHALNELPEGRQGLQKLLLGWPKNHADPVAAMSAAFPGISDGSRSLEKWWTLSLARLAKMQKLMGLPPRDTDREIERLITFDLPAVAKNPPQTVQIRDFEEILRHPAGRQMLAERHVLLTTFLPRAHPLLRPALDDYEAVIARLIAGEKNYSALRKQIVTAEAARISAMRALARTDTYLGASDSEPVEVLPPTATAPDASNPLPPADAFPD